MASDTTQTRNPRIEFGDGRQIDPTKAMEEVRKMKFGLDMVEAGIAHVEFLADVDKHPCLYTGKYVQNAICRYETLWLPLAAKHVDERLAAPLDIEWIWHCHLLAPVLYEKDCHRMFQVTVNHKLYRRDDRKHALKRSKHLWEEAYQNEPFEIDLPTDSKKSETVELYYTKLSYDLTAATSRQCVFFYNVSLPHYLDKRFLYMSEMRYKMFLYLRKYAKDAYLVPCFDNDLMWHTHQLHPVIYKADTQRIMGRFFNHDDTTNDRTEGTILWNGTVDTMKLWKEMFASEYNMSGAMFRGKESRGLYHEVSVANLGVVVKDEDKTEISLVVDSVALEKIPDGEYGFNFSLEIFQKTNSDRYNQVLTLDGPNLVWTREDMQPLQLMSLQSPLYIRISLRKGKLFHKNEIVNENKIVPSELVQTKSSLHAFAKSLTLPGKKSDNVVFMRGLICQKYPRICLNFLFGDFRTCVLPHNLDASFLVEESDLDPCSQCGACYLAEHRLKDSSDSTTLTCRVLHSPHRLSSACQILQGDDADDIVSCAHLIDSSHLPIPTLVMDKEIMMTLDPHIRQRALLIKDNNGDWGVVTGYWGVNYLTQKGALFVKFLHCASGMVTHHSIPTENNSTVLDIGNVRIDFSRGSIECYCNPSEIPQFTALSLALGTLLVLCIPRDKRWTPGNKVSGDETGHVSPDDLKLAVGCGLHIQTPSNHYRFDRKS